MKRIPFFTIAVSCLVASCFLTVSLAEELQTDDNGFVKHTLPISMSHSVGWLRQKDKDLLQEKLTGEVYQAAVTKFGEAPTEEAVFRIYLPKDAKHIQSLFLISEHGVSGPMMEHRLLREFADRHAETGSPDKGEEQ